MDIKKTISEMTLEEKATLLTGKHNWFFNGVPRLGIRDFVVGDGPHGLRAYENLFEDGGVPHKRMPATMFPCASAMSSTWNPDLIYKVGETIGKECNHYNVDVILAPGANGKRSPLGGRNFEYYSEDPVLTAKIATSYVLGVQSQGVGTSLKHFVLNEQEHSRRFISSIVDERTFRELYAYPYEKVVKSAKPLTIMSSYNKIDGVYASESPALLRDLLKKSWGYEGIVISDWGAVQNKRKSVLAGLDIEMPQSEWKDAFIQDVIAGKYDLDLIDETVLRILKAYDWMLQNKNHGKQTNFEENHLLASKVAEEAICLLKNQEKILPLKKDEKILVLGELAIDPRIGGGGSADLLPYKIENPLSELKKKSNITFFGGYQFTREIEEAIKNHDKILIFTGTTSKIESEGFDRSSLNLPEEQIELVLKASQITSNIIIINSSGSSISVHPFINHVKGMIQSWFLGSACGKPLADILFGDLNPSGKLSETFPVRIENTSTHPAFPSKGVEAKYMEGLFTGYRFYDTHELEVSYPFGFGLSYSTFEYSNLHFSSDNIKKEEDLTIRLDIKNTGEYEGKETVLLFVGYPQQEFTHPKKVLKAFSKVSLLPNETKTVELKLSSEDFEVYSVAKKEFLVEKGEYSIYIGKNVSEIIYTQPVFFDSTDVCHTQKTADFPAKVWLESDPEKSKLENLLLKFRPLHWWETEEPLDRILKRLVKENNLSQEDYENMLDFLNIKNEVKL
ncbi:MAG: glycoside hydrolase family 3 C-terminal domain-containing protein [Firmicutes bacterium]|nr:glycoside hydrolase family 3 C-terminal domain-containing protein [Bacillota bacterium]